MRLSEFIVSNREPILAEWETFARSCTPASNVMGIEALRDHADQMLTAIAKDLETGQSQLEQAEKAAGQSDAEQAEPTAAEEHGAGRAESGFSVEQMVAEYRALRASVIRLWKASRGQLKPSDIEDLTRFNEAIDQALAESVTRFAEDLEHSKEMFLGILGHDLRTPLGAITTASQFMLETEELEEPHRSLTARIKNSATRMTQMVGDLLDFTRSRLGGGIPITRQEIMLGRVLHDVVDEVCAANPDWTIQISTRDEQLGEWDPARIEQALTNLVANAVQHGTTGSEVEVELQGDEDAVAITIHNWGPPIPEDRLDGLFNPMKPQGPSGGNATGNLGLGLYIAERIVHAHDGRIEVESSEEGGTRFTVFLPRRGSEEVEEGKE